MLSNINLTTFRIADFYNANQNSLAISLQRLSTGKKYLQPKDGISEFMRVQKLQQDRRGYEVIKKDLQRGYAIVTVAEKAGDQIVETVKEMKELVHGGTTSKQIMKGETAGVDLLQLLDSLAHGEFAGRSLHCDKKLLYLKGLDDIIVGTTLDKLQSLVNISKSGDQDNKGFYNIPGIYLL